MPSSGSGQRPVLPAGASAWIETITVSPSARADSTAPVTSRTYAGEYSESAGSRPNWLTWKRTVSASSATALRSSSVPYWAWASSYLPLSTSSGATSPTIWIPRGIHATPSFSSLVPADGDGALDRLGLGSRGGHVGAEKRPDRGEEDAWAPSGCPAIPPGKSMQHS